MPKIYKSVRKVFLTVPDAKPCAPPESMGAGTHMKKCNVWGLTK